MRKPVESYLLAGGLSVDPDLFLGRGTADYYVTEGRSFAPEGAGKVQWCRRRNLGLLRAIPGADYAIGGCHPEEQRTRLFRQLRRNITDAEVSTLCQALGLEVGWFDEPHRASDIPHEVVRHCWSLSSVMVREAESKKAAQEAREAARECKARRKAERKTLREEEADSRARKALLYSIRRMLAKHAKASKRRRRAVWLFGQRIRRQLWVQRRKARLSRAVKHPLTTVRASTSPAHTPAVALVDRSKRRMQPTTAPKRIGRPPKQQVDAARRGLVAKNLISLCGGGTKRFGVRAVTGISAQRMDALLDETSPAAMTRKEERLIEEMLFLGKGWFVERTQKAMPKAALMARVDARVKGRPYP